MTLRCRSYAANEWLSGLPAASSILLGQPAVEVRSSGEGRGLGLFAVRTIPAFSRILLDAPLVLMKPGDDLPELYQQFQSLPSDKQEVYLNLSYHQNPARDALLKDKLLQRGFGTEGLEQMAKVAGIMQTNGFNVDIQDGQGSCHRALFPTIARINHSCAPNAHVCFYPPSEQNPRGQMIIHTLKALEPGDEFVISYFNILLPRSERQQKTQKWGFDCKCPVCDEDSPNQQHLEEQRKACRDFTFRQQALIQSPATTRKSINLWLSRGRSIVAQAADCPELCPAMPDLYGGLGVLADQKLEGQKLNPVPDLEKSVIWEARITGKDSPATQRRLQKLGRIAARRGGKYLPRIYTDAGGDYVVGWSES